MEEKEKVEDENAKKRYGVTEHVGEAVREGSFREPKNSSNSYLLLL